MAIIIGVIIDANISVIRISVQGILFYKKNETLSYLLFEAEKENEKLKSDKKAIAISQKNACIFCGNNPNVSHSCKKCNEKYKNKSILLRIDNCNFPVDEPLYESYGKILKTIDGHIVKSKSEAKIDNWFYTNNIFHAYEAELYIGKNKSLKPDFCLKNYLGEDEDVYVEYFGLQGDEDYDKITEYKMNHYKALKITLVCLYPDDYEDLDTALEHKILNKKNIRKNKINFLE